MTNGSIDIGEISVTIEDLHWLETMPMVESVVKQAVRAALTSACPGLENAGIAILLVNDKAIQTLNRTWRDKDLPTNVLSFPATDTTEGDMPEPDFPGGPLELGDIVLARETCEHEALAQHKALIDHVLHLAVHGTLHLLGYGHDVDADADRMERLETHILAGIGIKDPYVETELHNYG